VSAGTLQRTEWNERPDVSIERPLIDPRCARDILYRDAGGIEHRDFVYVRATWLTPDDKVSKVRELRVARERGVPDDPAAAHKLDHYRRSLDLLDELAPGTPLVLRLGRELDQLDALPQLAPAR